MPDHLNPNLFYVAPTVMLIAKDTTGLPQFSYLEYGSFFGDKGAVLQTTLRPQFSSEMILEAQNRIKQINPQAQFTTLTFTGSAIRFSDRVLTRFVNVSECSHAAGRVDDEQTCAFDLNRTGRETLRPMLKKGLTLTAQLEYSIDGVLQGADGSYTRYQNKYEMAARIGGPDLACYPQLFRDSQGRQIQDGSKPCRTSATRTGGKGGGK
jgi:hypothetical protein